MGCRDFHWADDRGQNITAAHIPSARNHSEFTSLEKPGKRRLAGRPPRESPGPGEPEQTMSHRGHAASFHQGRVLSDVSLVSPTTPLLRLTSPLPR